MRGDEQAVTLYGEKRWKSWTAKYYDVALTFFDTMRPASEREAAARKILPDEGPMHYIEPKKQAQ